MGSKKIGILPPHFPTEQISIIANETRGAAENARGLPPRFLGSFGPQISPIFAENGSDIVRSRGEFQDPPGRTRKSLKIRKSLAG